MVIQTMIFIISMGAAKAMAADCTSSSRIDESVSAVIVKY